MNIQPSYVCVAHKFSWMCKRYAWYTWDIWIYIRKCILIYMWMYIEIHIFKITITTNIRSKTQQIFIKWPQISSYVSKLLQEHPFYLTTLFELQFSNPQPSNFNKLRIDPAFLKNWNSSRQICCNSVWYDKSLSWIEFDVIQSK